MISESAARKKNARGFTLLEIVVVIVLLGLLASMLFRSRLNSFRYWEQEGAIRRLSEVIAFLYSQSVTDGNTYRLEFDFESDPQTYRIGQIAEDSFADTLTNSANTGLSPLTIKINNYLNPKMATYYSMFPPEDIPSLRDPIELPQGVYIEDVRTVRGLHTSSSDEEKPFMIFFPRGFAEFCVIHLKLEREEDAFVTILVNPYTGVADVFREYKDFKWTYTQDRK